jgi:hypothetical protein
MSSVVVDTDVVSFVFKNHPISAWCDADLAGRTLIASFLCTKWAEVTVAATALIYDLPLVTHNRGDYRGVPGLGLISHSG